MKFGEETITLNLFIEPDGRLREIRILRWGNQTEDGSFGYIPCGTAGAVSEQLEIIVMLLQYGADPAAKDARGRSALDWATNERVSAALQKNPVVQLI